MRSSQGGGATAGDGKQPLRGGAWENATHFEFQRSVAIVLSCETSACDCYCRLNPTVSDIRMTNDLVVAFEASLKHFSAARSERRCQEVIFWMRALFRKPCWPSG
jgi:hypothetical protein